MSFSLLTLLVCQTLGSIAVIAATTVAVLAGTSIAPVPSLGTLGVAAMAIGTMIFVPISGRMSARAGRRTTLSLGALLGAGAAMLLAASVHARSFTLFVVASTLVGAGYATLLSYRFAAAATVEPELRARVHSAFLATGLVASIAGPLLAERFARSGGLREYAGSFVVAGAAWSICALLLVTVSGRSIVASDAFPAKPPRHAGASTPFVLTALAGSVVATGCMTAMMQGMPLAMTASHHSLHGVSTVMQAHFLGMYVPGLFAAGIISRFGVRRTIVIGALVGFAGALTALSGRDMDPFVVALTACGLAWGLIIVASGAAISEYADLRWETRYNFAVSSSAALIALIVGFGMESIGWSGINTMVLAAFAVLVGIVCFAGRSRL